MAKLIDDDWTPSKNLYDWAKINKIDLGDIHKCVYDFIFWHKEKRVKRVNFNLAFKNWLKKEFTVIEKRMEKTKAASPSYSEYQPPEKIVKNKTAGRDVLKQLKRRLK